MFTECMLDLRLGSVGSSVLAACIFCFGLIIVGSVDSELATTCLYHIKIVQQGVFVCTTSR